MMSGIRGRDTKPEMLLRRGLHAMGFRFRVSDRKLPGSPDLVFPRYRAVLFAHGCFWHGHDCHLFRLPGTRREFWQEKIHGNVERDREVIEALRRDGWRIGTVWECALKGKTRRPAGEVVEGLAGWLRGNAPEFNAEGDSK